MSSSSIHEKLHDVFGYDTLYPTQERAIASVLKGDNVFVLMPTGGGKSLCYQLPAVIMPGVTIVISPLIALMKDQVDSLRAYGVSAAYLNSSLDAQEQNEVIQQVTAGELDLLYVSAERLVSEDFTSILQQIDINLFAIDEAHCISTWGHDFRPDYTQLSYLNRSFPDVPIIALTATADATTRRDILAQLDLSDPLQLVDSFDRPNISLQVAPARGRLQRIAAFLEDKSDQSGIIYCLTRKRTEKLAEQLQKRGLDAASYHAGMSSAERSRIQKSFSRDKTQIVCATVAFGMGIDKLNVRWVIHYNLPKNIEGYYQEIGRAGRDRAPAEALLFYTYADVERLKRFAISAKRKAVELAKLRRMKEYAEAVTCRRAVLLRYFGEQYQGSCGNCDVCESDTAYETLDGTAIAETLLRVVHDSSKDTATQYTRDALIRLAKKKVDTWISGASWNFYLAQLLNSGFIGLEFDEGQRVVLTQKGREFLDTDSPETISLVSLKSFIEKQEAAKKKRPTTRSTRSSSKNSDSYNDPLFEALREERLQISRDKDIPAYMVFSDKTLLEMTEQKPSNEKEMMSVSGVGAVKWERYGERFVSVIKSH